MDAAHARQILLGVAESYAAARDLAAAVEMSLDLEAALPGLQKAVADAQAAADAAKDAAAAVIADADRRQRTRLEGLAITLRNADAQAAQAEADSQERIRKAADAAHQAAGEAAASSETLDQAITARRIEMQALGLQIDTLKNELAALKARLG